MTRTAFILAISLTACGPSDGRQHASTLPSFPAADWKHYEGEGFTLRYPANATLPPARSHPSDLPRTAIRGPDVHVPIPPEAGPSDGPAFQLIVSAFPNPSGRTVEQWVDSIRRVRNDHDMDSDSLGFLEPPDTIAVNRLHGLRLRPFCGDCASEEIYLANGKQTVVLSYVYDIGFPGDREAQRKLYQAMLSTFAWKP